MWLYFGSILAYEYFRNNIKNINQKQFNREKDILRSRLLAVVRRRNSSIRLTGKKVHDSPIERGTSPSWPTKRAHYWVWWLHTKNFSWGTFSEGSISINDLFPHIFTLHFLSHSLPFITPVAWPIILLISFFFLLSLLWPLADSLAYSDLCMTLMLQVI